MRSIMVEAETPPEERAKITQELEQDFFPQLETKYPTITRRALGEQEAQQEFMGELGLYGIMCACVMFFLLAVVFRAYMQPLLIMSVIPFAFIGATVGHYIFGASFALFSVMGMVAAMGVVVNDNVVLVDRANQIRGYFAMRKKRGGAPAPEGSPDIEEISTPTGETWEIVKIAEVVELHADLIQASVAKGFRDAPIELRSSRQMFWEKSELREKTQALEAIGFMPMRVRAAPGIIEASISRFRQIFLTSVTEFIGLMPMLLENAAIVQFLKPMAIGLAFGVLFCMPVTLILTPVLYMIGVEVKGWILWAWGSKQPRPVPAE
jgi:Cu/Ag efflux pump CusA